MSSSSELVTSSTGGAVKTAGIGAGGAWFPTIITTPNTRRSADKSNTSSIHSNNITTPGSPPVSSLQFPTGPAAASFPSYAHTPSFPAATSDARTSGNNINHTTPYQNKFYLSSSPTSFTSPPRSLVSPPDSESFSPPVPPKSYPLPNVSGSTSRAATSPPFPYPYMGHSQSKPTSPPSFVAPSSTAAAVPPSPITQSTSKTPNTPTSTSSASRLKRAFAARRKKSGDATTHFAANLNSGSGITGNAPSSSSQKQLNRVDPSSSSVSLNNSTSTPSTKSAQLSSLTTHVLSAANKKDPKTPLQTSPLPPPPPNKDDLLVPPILQASPSKDAPTPHHSQSQLTSSGLLEVSKLTASNGAGNNRSSIIPLSPGISSAVTYMRELQHHQEEAPAEHQQGQASVPLRAPMSSSPLPSSSISKSMQDSDRSAVGGGEKPSSDKEKGEMKASWRKSDSTMSHHTIRAGTTRPVSMAESFQSAYTIVPSANKRLSTLTTDMDFGMPEEEEGPFKLFEDVAIANPNSNITMTTSANVTSLAYKTSPASSIRSKNRRSLSLNLGLSSTKPQIAPVYVNVNAYGQVHHGGAPAAEPKHLSHSISEGQSATISSSQQSISPPYNATRNPYPHPTITVLPQQSHTGGNSNNANFRGRFAAWASGSNSNSSGSVASSPTSRNMLPLPAPPPSAISPNATPSQSSNNPSSLRQTAISMTSGFAPAAGLAKRAVEKMGRKWGMGVSSSSSGSGYSSSSSSREAGAHSSSSHTDYQGSFIGRTNSNQSSIAPSIQSASGGIHHVHLPHMGNKTRRTPNAPSGSYSVTSSLTSNSDSDGFFPPVGPVLGDMVRGPVRNKHGGSVLGGVVFGRDLRGVVHQTKIGANVASAGTKPEENEQRLIGEREKLVKDLEERMLPALVARCAQHIIIWGVQEEGLFRVSGRASHVSKLRAEFDTGVDYDMTNCTPGDLDPHAVASVFKAYLRELPEPILTHKLHPLFDAALNKELASHPPEPPAALRAPNRGQGLPSGPKGSFNMPIRKPPSLSTLAMPSFTGMPAPSQTLLKSLKSLIAELPLESHDLVRTVVELIKMTARASKETKMPLSNLLLVFCPSLNMSPPLLRVLCEGEGIWDPAPVEQDVVLDIKRESVVLDISADKPGKSDGAEPEEEDFSDAQDGLEAERSSVQSSEHALSDHQSSEYHASAESGSLLDEGDPVQRRWNLAERPEIPTVYLDSQSRCSSSSISSTQEPVVHLREGATTDVQSISSSGCYTSNIALTPSPPPLSSSAESVASPISSRLSSFSQLPLDDVKDAHGLFQPSKHTVGTGAPKIVDTSPLALQAKSKHLVINNLIPTDVAESAQYPKSPPPAPAPTRRRSIPILKLPTFSPIATPSLDTTSDAPSPVGSGSVRGLRGKRPSLRRLFTKRSNTSLGSSSGSRSHLSSPHDGSLPYLQTPRSASDSSVSTPRSAVTAPQSSISLHPPVLDTPIEASSFRFELGFDISPTGSTEGVDGNVPTALTAETTFYASALSSQVSLHSPISPAGENRLRLEPTNRHRLLSASSSTSLNHLGILDDDDDEDWTQSVLIAANADGNLRIQRPA